MKRLPLLLLLCAHAAYGQVPPDPPKPPPAARATVTPSGPVPPGTFLVIDATATVADSVLWDTDLDPATFRIDTNKRIVTLSAPAVPGAYTFRLDAFRIVDGQIAADRTKPTFTVVGTIKPAPPPDTPPAPPGPGPVVTPPPAAGDPLGLTAATRAILATRAWDAASLAWRQTVLARVFADAAAAPAGKPQDYLNATEAAYRAAITPAGWPAWKAALFDPLQPKLAALTAAGKLATVADLAEAFREISEALKEAPEDVLHRR